ncbi:hypothetical protein [Archangium sp.]|uniref:hypothetical protein n=1 Tax=Archangium sp. TaxID=1872627 RepID=UPI003899E73C
MKRLELLACAFVLAACGEVPQAPAPVMKDNLGVDFSSVRGLAIGTSSASQERQLLTLDSSNQLQPVDLTTVGSGNPRELYDTPRFVLLVVSDVTYKDQTCASVLVRKSDSAQFCVPVAPASYRLNNSARVQWGDSGNLLTLDGGNSVYRIDASTEPLQLTTLGFDGAELVNFAVNAVDDVMVTLRQDNGTVIRVYPRSGAPQFITARNETCVLPGLAGSRDYYLALGWSDKSTVDHVMGLADGTYSAPTNVWTSGPSVWNDCGVVYRDQSRLIVLASTTLLELVNPSGTPRVLSVPMKVARGGSFFNWGQDSDGFAFVTRYDLPDLAPVELLKAAPYRLGKVDVSPSGEVTFVATRLSDGLRVVGTLRGGTLSVSELTQSQPEILTLVRIN